VSIGRERSSKSKSRSTIADRRFRPSWPSSPSSSTFASQTATKTSRAELEKHVAERRAAITKEVEARRKTCIEQREQLDLMRQKADLLAEKPSGVEACDGTEFSVGDDEVEVAFLRERHKRARA
jgi:hypothetical protein